MALNKKAVHQMKEVASRTGGKVSIIEFFDVVNSSSVTGSVCICAINSMAISAAKAQVEDFDW